MSGEFPDPFDYYENAAQRIIESPSSRAVKATAGVLEDPPWKPHVSPEPTKRTGVKKEIRRALRDVSHSLDLGLPWVEVNALTNLVYGRVVRPLLAQVFADGVEAGREDLASCCGCSGGDGVTNPYDGSAL